MQCVASFTCWFRSCHFHWAGSAGSSAFLLHCGLAQDALDQQAQDVGRFNEMGCMIFACRSTVRVHSTGRKQILVSSQTNLCPCCNDASFALTSMLLFAALCEAVSSPLTRSVHCPAPGTRPTICLASGKPCAASRVSPAVAKLAYQSVLPHIDPTGSIIPATPAPDLCTACCSLCCRMVQCGTQRCRCAAPLRRWAHHLAPVTHPCKERRWRMQIFPTGWRSRRRAGTQHPASALAACRASAS